MLIHVTRARKRDRTTHCGVRNVLAVLRQQIVDLMSGRDADVKRIYRRLLRQDTALNPLASKLGRLVSERENRNPAECPQPAGTRNPIADSSLIENDLRDKQTVETPPSPPTPSEFAGGP